MPRVSQAAFGELHRRAARPLWGFVYRATGNAADADDIVQEAFLRLLRADLPALGAEGQRRYLFRIASNLMTDRWRRGGREEPLADEGALPAPAPGGLDAADDRMLRRLFGRLRPRDRALLWLAYVEGLSHEEIGEALELARGSVKVMLFRARTRLRDLLRAGGMIEDER